MTDTVIEISAGEPVVIEVGYGEPVLPPFVLQTMSLDVQRRDSSFTMPSSPATFIWDTEVVDTGGVYDVTTGVSTFGFTGNYTFNFQFNLNAGSGYDILYAFVELSTDGGITWQTSEYSGRRLVIMTQGQQLLFHSTNKFAAGTKARFSFFSTVNNTTISTLNIPQSSAKVPAARLMVTGYSV